MGKQIEVKFVNAYSEIPFRGGNPAAVIWSKTVLKEDLMQKIARNICPTHTMFITPFGAVDPSKNSEAQFSARFFSSKGEINFSHHAIIAAFYIMAKEGLITLTEEAETIINLDTRGGLIKVYILQHKGSPSAALLAQRKPSFCGANLEINKLSDILAIPIEELSKDENLPPEIVSTGSFHLILPVMSKTSLMACKPDVARLKELCKELDVNSIHIFSLPLNDQEPHVYSRNLRPSPALDDEIGEEASCGGNSALGCYLWKHKLLKNQNGKNSSDQVQHFTFTAAQGNQPDEMSQVVVEITTLGNSIESIRAGGKAVVILKGTLQLI